MRFAFFDRRSARCNGRWKSSGSAHPLAIVARSAWTRQLACLQHAEAQDQELAHRRHNDLLGLKPTRALQARNQAATAGLKRIADSAGMWSDDRSVALLVLEMRVGRSIEEPDR
jgi:hypothetical protein